MKYFTLLLVVMFSVTSLYSQWQIQYSGTTEKLNDVAILDQTSAIVVGDNGTILKTTNNGNDWITKISGTTNHFNAVSFRDDENGIAVGIEVVCRTTDGGENWNSTTSLGNFLTVSYRDIYFVGPNIIIGDDNGFILYSADDGVTWYLTQLFSSQPLIAVGFNYNSPSIHSPLAYVATTYNTGVSLFPSSNWNIYTNPVIAPWDILTGGEFYDDNQYLVGWNGNPGPRSVLLRRANTDTSWQTIYSFIPGPFIPNDIKGVGEFLFICGSEGKIFISTDYGNNWQNQISNTVSELNAVDIINDTIGYSVGEAGTILFTSNGGGVNSVDEAYQPSSVHLFQNYPNPFNPSTTIEYEINSRQYVQLKVFDLLGNEISNLVNEEQEAGTHGIEFDKSESSIELGSGIYFYQLITIENNSESIKTRKMILLK